MRQEIPSTRQDVVPPGAASSPVAGFPTPTAEDLLAQITDVVMYQDLDRLVAWVSPSVTRLLGWRPSDLVGRSLAELWHPDDGPRAAEARAAALAGDTVRLRGRVRCADSTYRWVEVLGESVRAPEGSVVGYVTVSRDVEEQVVSELALASSRSIISSVLSAMTDPLCVLAPVERDGEVVDFVVELGNLALSRFLGMPDGEYGQSLADLQGKAATEYLLPMYVHTLRTGEPLSLDDVPRLEPSSGEIRYYDLRAVSTGRGVTVMFRDVTDRHQDAQVTADELARYRLIAEMASDVVFQGSTEAVIEWISPSVRPLLGWAPEDVMGRRAIDFVDPEHRPVLLAASARVGEGRPVSFEAPFLQKDGTSRWLAVTVQPVFDEHGTMVGRVGSWRDVQREHQAREALSYSQQHDPVTGLPNRAWLMSTLRVELDSARRQGRAVGLLSIDVDDFHEVNDSLGHAAGDAVLSTIANRLQMALGEGDRLGRHGGDEFTVIVPGASGFGELEALADRVGQALDSDVHVEDHDLQVSVSIGLALSGTGSTAEQLQRDADSAVNAAKRSGRARWRVAEGDAHERSLARVTLSQEIRAGIAGRQFVVAYQPIVRLDDGSVVGHEALVRWRHPTRGLLPPGAFLDVAEEYSGIVEIGHQVLEQVCRDLNGPLSPRLGTVSLNVSAVQLRHDDWVASFLSVTDRLRVPRTRVTVEVTETAVIGDPTAAAAKLQTLRDRGFGVHVDDFGTGNSSISLLLDLPLTGLKLDSRFTWQLSDAGGTASTLSSSLAGLAQSLGLTGVAEGVETVEQRRILQQHGWVLGQGYLFGKPTLL